MPPRDLGVSSNHPLSYSIKPKFVQQRLEVTICKSPDQAGLSCKLAKAYPPCSQNMSHLWCIYQLSKKLHVAKGGQKHIKSPVNHPPCFLSTVSPGDGEHSPCPPGRGRRLKGRKEGASSPKHSPAPCTCTHTLSSPPLPPFTFTSPPPRRRCAQQTPSPVPPHHSGTELLSQGACKAFAQKPCTQPGSAC